MDPEPKLNGIVLTKIEVRQRPRRKKSVIDAGRLMQALAGFLQVVSSLIEEAQLNPGGGIVGIERDGVLQGLRRLAFINIVQIPGKVILVLRLSGRETDRLFCVDKGMSLKINVSESDPQCPEGGEGKAGDGAADAKQFQQVVVQKTDPRNRVHADFTHLAYRVYADDVDFVGGSKTRDESPGLLVFQANSPPNLE